MPPRGPLWYAGPVSWDAPELLLAVGLGGGAAFLGSMPVAGPLAVLVLQRAVSGQRASAMAAAAGGGLVEGAYALGIGLTLPLVMREIEVVVPVSRGLGAIVIAGIGIALVLKPHFFESPGREGKRRSLLAGVAVTAVNPTLLASWTVVISTLYANGWLRLTSYSAFPFAIGVVLGTTGWFVLVALLGNRFEKRMTLSKRRLMIRVLGGVLLLGGLYFGIRFAIAAPWR